MGVAAAAAHLPLADAAAHAAGYAAHTATLDLFARWFKASFARVEAVREAKRQVEFDFGQTQALEQHEEDFNELLEKTGELNVLLGQPAHIDHYLSSLFEARPAELTEQYDPPRKTVEDAHATIRNGDGYATLLLVQEAAREVERAVSADGRRLGLQ